VVFLLAVVTAASFRSLAPASVRPLEATDFRWYRQVAENLEAGRGLTFEGEQLAVRYPPGYPVVLAGLFRLADGAGLSHDRAVDGFIPLVVGVCAVLAFLVARRLFGTGVAWLSALLWITHPMNLAMASQPYSELPFTAVVYAAVLLFIAAFQAGRRVPWAMLAVGALVGAASLIRPIAVGLVAVFGAAAARRDGRLLLVARDRRAAAAPLHDHRARPAAHVRGGRPPGRLAPHPWMPR